MRTINVLLAVGVLGLCGCVVVGPRSITAGRAAYTEVINRTADEQVLNVIVRQRYDETFGMLRVASVTANMRFSARVEGQTGFSSNDGNRDNLVPFSAGISFEENPTISYVPLTGAKFNQEMLSSVTPMEWHLLSGPVKNPSVVLALALRRINGMRNPLPGEAPRPPGFSRFLELYDLLRRAQALDRVHHPEAGKDAAFYWAIHDYKGKHVDSVREFLELLGIDAKPDGSTIVLPVRIAVGSSSSAVHVEGRSAFDVLRAFGAGIEVPPDHLQAGIVESLTFPVPEDERIFTIRSSAEHPADATVQINFRDRWFYIDATDGKSKRAFAFLRTFIGLRLSDSETNQEGPVLTMPVN
jgi:hypothetical protein